MSKQKKGQSTLEIIIAMAILTICLSSAIMISLGSQSTAIDAQLNNQALYLAEKQIEIARANIANDFNSVVSSTSNEDIFTKELVVSNVDNSTKKVVSRISWKTDPLRPQKIELKTLFTDRKGLIDYGGDTGGSPPSGNWGSLQTLGSVDIGAGNSATDIDVFNSIVYLSSEASSKSKPDIHTFNASNPAAPLKLDDIDIDAYAAVSIDFNNKYIYAASTGVIPDLKIVNAANPSALSLASEFNVITMVDAKSVFKCGSIVFIGVKKSSINGEFFTIDVSNPAHPSQLDVFEINGDVNKIFVKDDFAYVASSRDDKELFILDVSDSRNIHEAGYLNISGATDAMSVFIVNPSQIFLGVGNVLYIVNASNPAAPIITGSIDVGGTVNDIYAAGSLVFLATSNSNREFQVINIADPAHPAIYSYLNFPQVASGIDYENNIVYVSVRSNDGLRIITSASN